MLKKNIKLPLLLILSYFFIFHNAYSQPAEHGPDNYIIRSITVLGNNKTKEKIIRRELLFKEGDTVPVFHFTKKIKLCKENLQNTSLFNFVEVQPSIIGNLVDIQVVVQERWYFWPSFYFNHTERNFNVWWQEKDLSKLTAGVGIQVKNMRGRNENFKIDTRFGYKTRVEFSYDNISIDKSQKHHIGVYYAFQTQDQLPYITTGNKPQYIRIKGNPILFFQEANFKYFYRPKHKFKHHVELRFYNLNIKDTISNLNTDYLLNGNNNLKFFRLSYFFEFENRDFSHYPLDGQYLSLSIMKNGLGFIPQNSFRNEILSGTLIEHYKVNNRISMASGWFGKYSTNKNIPYAFIDGLGYQKNLRGFDFYTIEGSSYILSQQQMKFTLIKPFDYKIPYINNPKFSKIFFAYYLNLFSDFAYVWPYPNNYEYLNNSLQKKLLYSFGIGMDFVTYYDKIVRIDFVHNSLNENGVFLSFKASIHK